MAHPEATEQPEPIKEEVKKPSRDMVPTIDEIVARLDSFVQKANQVVEMSTNFEKWGKKGKLRGFNPTMTWAVFKEKLESLKKTLHTIKSLDPKTQKPKYLVDLTANDALCNNIIQFKTVLAKHEPGVQVPSFGFKKLSKSSKAAFIAIINDCLEALLALNMQTELEKIIAKYEPTAKKIKDAEEKAQEIALQASKQPRVPGKMTTTVRHEEPGYYEFGVPGKAGYQPYGPMPGYAPEKRREAVEEEKGGKAKEHGEKPEGKGAEAAKKEDKKGPESKKEDVKDTETTKKIDGKFFEFESGTGDAIAIATNSQNFKDASSKTRSNDQSEVDKLNKDIGAINGAVVIASKAARDAGRLMATLDKNQAQLKEKAVAKFRTSWGDDRSSFTNIVKKLQEIPAAPATLAGQEKSDLVKSKEKLKENADQLISDINSLNDEVNGIGTGTKKHFRFH